MTSREDHRQIRLAAALLALSEYRDYLERFDRAIAEGRYREAEAMGRWLLTRAETALHKAKRVGR